MIQLDWTFAEVAESSALGAAFMGGLGIYDSVDDLNALPWIERRFSPELSQLNALIFRDQCQDAVQRVVWAIGLVVGLSFERRDFALTKDG
jgi:glycerol kinase